MSLDQRASEVGTNTFIDLFAGCGGLSLGLMNAGWKGLFAIEKAPRAFLTLQKNLIEGSKKNFTWPVWLPREPFELSEFLNQHESRLRELQGKVTLVAGGPPCQGFSLAGRRRANDPRNHLFMHFLRVVEIVRPRFVLIENVQGIDIGHRSSNGSRQQKAYSARIRDHLLDERYGYLTWGSELRAEDFGVAQRRLRYFILGIRRDILPHVSDGYLDPFEELHELRVGFLKQRGLRSSRPVTTGEAISDLEIEHSGSTQDHEWPSFKKVHYAGPRTDYQRLLHGEMDGLEPNSLRIPNHRPDTIERFKKILETCRPGAPLTREEREAFNLRKHTIILLSREMPAPTLTTLPDDFVHYSEPRVLTVREMARLQSFPDWFAFHGKYTTGGQDRAVQVPRYSQVGNAVPPLLAEALGALILRINNRGLGGKSEP